MILKARSCPWLLHCASGRIECVPVSTLLIVLLLLPMNQSLSPGCGAYPGYGVKVAHSGTDSGVHYTYTGTVHLNMTWSEHYGDTHHRVYNTLYRVIYPTLVPLFCRLNQTRDIFEDVTNVTFSPGSVLVHWTVSLTRPLDDPGLLSVLVSDNLSQDPELRRDMINLESVKSTIMTVLASISAVSGLVMTGVLILGIVKRLAKQVKKAVAGIAGGTSGIQGPFKSTPQTTTDQDAPSSSTAGLFDMFDGTNANDDIANEVHFDSPDEFVKESVEAQGCVYKLQDLATNTYDRTLIPVVQMYQPHQSQEAEFSNTGNIGYYQHKQTGVW